MTNDIDADLVRLGERASALPRIAAIHKRGLQAGVFAHRLCHGGGRGVAVLDPSRRDHHGQQQPQRVDHQVTFAPFDLFARIKAAVAALW